MLLKNCAPNAGCDRSVQQRGDAILQDGDDGNPTVLIVEDDLSLAEEMAISVRHHGMNVVTAPDWDQALARVEARPVDIIVLEAAHALLLPQQR